MNRYQRIIAAFLTLAVAFSLQAGDRSEVWKRMYNRAMTIDQQYAIMQNIVAMDDPSLIDMLDDALAEQIASLEDQMNRTERARKDELMRMIVNELSALKAEESAGTIFTLYNAVDNHILKADCLVALGNIRAIDLVPQVSMILRNLNFNTNTEPQVAEILAFAAVVSLERMRDIQGFEQVFYASQGWYSRRVKDRAAEALKIISDDPTEPIIAILTGPDSNYKTKLTALEVENESTAPVENKNRVAILALQEGLRYSPNNKTEGDQLAKLRQTAMVSLIENGYKGPDVAEDLGRAYERAEDINERLISIQAMGVNGTDETVGWLSNKLSDFNDNQLSGIAANQTELIYIRQMISSLGLSGNVNAKPILLEVQFSDYTPAIVRLAKEAISNLE
jgi:hypothetical protein